MAMENDGDTLTATTPKGQDLGRVRLVGIDAAELDPSKCSATQARDYLTGLLPEGIAMTSPSQEGPIVSCPAA